ncbi:MAG TPA: hypothetical protein VFF79_17105 [Conexibacter sp.]|jgi:hypothetical protein|nr:hypothetical protein [Conexibacter sp.]
MSAARADDADDGPSSPMRSPVIARAALVLTALSTAGVGLVAAFAPRTFYTDFPYLGHWVDRLPPYNEHLVTDVGGLYLGFALLLAWAAMTLQRQLVQAACAAWILFSVLHAIFHARHLAGFGTADAVAEMVSLVAVIALPLVALWAARLPSG